jgi:hypothetical protein
MECGDGTHMIGQQDGLSHANGTETKFGDRERQRERHECDELSIVIWADRHFCVSNYHIFRPRPAEPPVSHSRPLSPLPTKRVIR